MSVIMKLSHSRMQKAIKCGMQYKYYYIDNLREKTISGALLFGSAFDNAIQVALVGKKDGVEVDEYAAFDQAWEVAYINGQRYSAPDCTLIGYAKTDFDRELLTEEDVKFLQAKTGELCPEFLAPEYDTVKSVYDALASYKAMSDAGEMRVMTENERKLHNLFNWMSMRRKGHLMLNANRIHILPRIKEVISVQKETLHASDDGERKIQTFLDLECIWEDGRHVIFDYKTSARAYEPNAVLTNQQLILYTLVNNVPNAGFFVFQKNIKKNRMKVCSVCQFESTGRHTTCNSEATGARCGGAWIETTFPEAVVDVLVDEISDRAKEITLENMNAVAALIESKTFVRNTNACGDFGGCPYYKMCWGKEPERRMEDLVQVEARN